jgi:hypothetical protein
VQPLPIALLGLVVLALAGYGAVTPWAAGTLHAATALVALGVAGFTRGHAVSPGALLLVALWVLLGFVSLLWTRAADASLDALGALVGGGSLFLLATGIRGRRSEAWLVHGLACVAGLVAVWAVVRVPADGDALGPFGNANHLAGWMLVPGALALSAFLHADIRRRGRRESAFLWFLLCGAAGAAVAVTGSLGGAIAGSAVVAAALCGHQIRQAHGSLSAREVRNAFVVLAGLYVAGALSLSLGPLLLPDQLTIKSSGSESSIGMRWAVYGAATRAGLDAAPWGTGLGGFAEAFRSVRPEGLPYGVRYAHNEPLHGWVELGWPFIVLALFSLVFVAQRIGRGLHRAPSRFRTGAVAGLIGVAVQSLFDFPLHVPAIAAVVAVSLGLAWRQSREDSTLSPGRSRAALASCGVLGLVLSGSQLGAIGYEEAARQSEASGDFEAAITRAESGLRFRPARWQLLALVATNADYARRFGAGGGGIEEIVTARRRAVDAAPQRADLRLQLAHAFSHDGDDGGAAREIGAAAALDPLSPAPRLAAASLALRRGDAAQAYAQLRAAIALHPPLATQLAQHAPELWGRLRSTAVAEGGALP